MTGTAQPGSDQERYARLLAIGTNAGLGMLVVLFGIYMLGVVDPHVPHERLPEIWHLPSGDFLELARLEAGWGWTARLRHADILTMLGIVTLAFCSVPCLAGGDARLLEVAPEDALRDLRARGRRDHAGCLGRPVRRPLGPGRDGFSTWAPQRARNQPSKGKEKAWDT